MNQEFLLKYCGLVSEFIYIPVRLYKNNKLVSLLYPLPVMYDPINFFEDKILEKNENINYYITENYNYYVSIKVKNYKIVIGPSTSNIILYEDVRKTFPKDKYSSVFTTSFYSFINSITKISLDSMLKLASLINANFNKEYNDSLISKHNQKDDIIGDTINGKMTNKTDNMYRAFKYNSRYFNIENTILSYVINGNIDQIIKYSKLYLPENSRLNTNQVEQAKVNFITQLTVVSRAVIKKGLDPNITGELIEKYSTELIKLNNINKIYILFNDMLLSFTHLIKVLKNNESYLINKINSYIEKNISINLKVNDIAKELYLSRPYLSSVYKKNTGIELSKQIYISKINYAKKLLEITTSSTQEIAQYLGFKTVSHFSTKFKEIAGCTPLEYKNSKIY